MKRHSWRQTLRRVACSALVLAAAATQSASLQAQAAVRVPRSVLEQYVGEYTSPDGGAMAITVRGDTLFREVPGQRVALVPLSNTRFRMGGVFTTEFIVDDAGGATQILSDGVEVERRLHRKSTGGAAVATRTASAAERVPRSVLERYAGTYAYIPGQMSRTDLRVHVRLRGDTLYRSMGGTQERALVPLSPTLFRVGDTLMQVEFVVDDAGVTQVLGTGFQQLLARRMP